MAIVIEGIQMETLVEQIAIAEDVSVTEVLRESLLSLAGPRGLAMRKAPLRERLATLTCEVDAVPARVPAGLRSDDDILGCNEHGVW